MFLLLVVEEGGWGLKEDVGRSVLHASQQR